MKKPNLLKGKNSYDAKLGDNLVPFLNRNITPYPTEVGAPNFDLVPVTKQKDMMINNARMYAQQEYNRIMELVNVLQRQADSIKRRLEITDAIYNAEYQFQVIIGKIYWLVLNTKKQKTLLSLHGPDDTLVKNDLVWIAKVKFLGDNTWTELDDNNNPIS